jgi:ribokinase
MDPRIIVVGSSNTDLIAYVERTPKIGETILGHKFSTGFGGKGANQAVMAARLTEKEGDVCMVTKIGKDLYGRETMKNYQDQRMNCKYIFETEEASTGVAPIIVDSEGRNSIVVVPGLYFFPKS